MYTAVWKSVSVTEADGLALLQAALGAEMVTLLLSGKPLQQLDSIKPFKATLKPLEKAFLMAPSGEAAEALRAEVSKMQAALDAAIKQQLQEDGIILKCDAAIARALRPSRTCTPLCGSRSA